MATSERELQKTLLEYFRERYQTRKHIKVLDLVKITDGWETDVYSFRLEYESTGKPHSNDLIFRMYPSDDAKEKSTKEFKVMAKLYEVGFPVPRVYHLEKDTSAFNKPFVIMEKINGQSMGEIIRASSEKTRADMISLFCKMLVDLHRLDIKPFASDDSLHTCIMHSIIPDPLYYNTKTPYDYMTKLLENFRRTMFNHRIQNGEFYQIIDWLEDRTQVVLNKRLSATHLDYHLFNVLIRDDGTPFVIDWTNFAIADYRLDLASTILLTSTYGNPKMRNYILETYENIAGSKAENIEYFEVVVAVRRLASIYLSLSEGAEKLGMRPETVDIMKKQTKHIKAVGKILRDRTGIAVREFDELLRL